MGRGGSQRGKGARFRIILDGGCCHTQKVALISAMNTKILR